ncbi:MAG: hypothetical protein M0Q38_06470 [Bacteroidales bacterium]|nr:hypothetical protein [Bacteroidales bacterium]
MFEIVKPHAFNRQSGYGLFRKLFLPSSKIREIQINNLLLTKRELADSVPDSFMACLRDEEHKAKIKFLKAIKLFNQEKLKMAEKEIRKICYGSAGFKLRSKTNDFIRTRAASIISLRKVELNEKVIHKIRRHLKAISNVGTLVLTVKPTGKLDKLITAINKIEMMISDWHGRDVLKETVERFLEINMIDLKKELISLNKLKMTLIDYDQNLYNVSSLRLIRS